MEKNREESPGLNEGLILLMVEKGLLSKASLGIDEQRMHQIYARAKQLYDAGRYNDARQLFSMLTLLEFKNPSYLYGLASSAMMLNDLDAALNAFNDYCTIEPKDPTAYFYMASCYEKKNDIPSVLIALQTVVNTAENQPQHQGMKQRALLALENYIKLLSEQGHQIAIDDSE